jgi:acyl-CoA reductase-like NAD-dependent aldehyde dehydrogenase
MRIVKEEVFGLVCVIIKFDDEDDALGQVNETSCGSAAVVHEGYHARNPISTQATCRFRVDQLQELALPERTISGGRLLFLLGS